MDSKRRRRCIFPCLCEVFRLVAKEKNEEYQVNWPHVMMDEAMFGQQFAKALCSESRFNCLEITTAFQRPLLFRQWI